MALNFHNDYKYQTDNEAKRFFGSRWKTRSIVPRLEYWYFHTKADSGWRRDCRRFRVSSLSEKIVTTRTFILSFLFSVLLRAAFYRFLFSSSRRNAVSPTWKVRSVLSFAIQIRAEERSLFEWLSHDIFAPHTTLFSIQREKSEVIVNNDFFVSIETPCGDEFPALVNMLSRKFIRSFFGQKWIRVLRGLLLVADNSQNFIHSVA